MSENLPDPSAIEEEVKRRFQPSNPITQAIAEKLVETLHQQRRCESLIEFARSIPTRKLDALPESTRKAFQKNVRRLLERVKELKRTSREYSNALTAEAPTDRDSSQPLF